MENAVVVLAAGKSTRMQSSYPKYFHEVGGKPLIDYITDVCDNLNFSKKIIVNSKDVFIEKQGWQRVIQGPEKGTAAAVLAAKEALADFKGNVLILYSDSPFISTATIQNMLKQKNASTIVSLGFNAENPFGYGRIVEDKNNTIKKIVEEKDATETEKKITLCNAGHLVCDGEYLFKALAKIGNTNKSKEYLLTDIISIARDDEKKVSFVVCDESEVMGVNTRFELAQAEAFFQKRKRQEAMDNGVTLMSPETTFFSYDTVIGKDCIVEPNVYFAPGAYIEAGTRVSAFSRVDASNVRSSLKKERIFSFKIIMIILFVVIFVLSPLWIWMLATPEKRGLCLTSLELCAIQNKNDNNTLGIIDCAFGNVQCLLSDVDTSKFEANEIEVPKEDLEKFLENQKKTLAK